MLIRILICIILLIIGHSLVAPAQSPVTDNTEEVAREKKSTHYIGLQANQLIRQIFNFGGNSGAVQNPYLLVYSVNSNTTGFGFATGLGLVLNQTKTNDGFSSTTSKISDVSWRFGLEKKKYLSKRWLTSFGGDILIESNKAETTSATSGFNSTVTTEIKRWGFGPRASLNYQFHPRLLVGTEASLYLKFINQTQTNTNTGQPSDVGAKLKSFTFILPAVIFINMRF